MDVACPLSPRAKDFSISSLMTGPAGLDSMLESGTTIITTSTTSSSHNSSNSGNSPNSRTSIPNINNNNNNSTIKGLSSSESPSHRLDPTGSGLGIGSAGNLGGLGGSESLSSILGHCIAPGVHTPGQQGPQDCVFSSWSQQVSQYNTLSSMQACVTGAGMSRRFHALQYDHQPPPTADHQLGTPPGMAPHLAQQQHTAQDNTGTTNSDCKTEGANLQQSSPGLESASTVPGSGAGSTDDTPGGDKNSVGESSDSGRGTGGPKPEPSLPSEPLHYKLLHVECKLEMKALWDRFDSLGTEMIVTKLGSAAVVQRVLWLVLRFNIFKEYLTSENRGVCGGRLETPLHTWKGRQTPGFVCTTSPIIRGDNCERHGEEENGVMADTMTAAKHSSLPWEGDIVQCG
ncbi:T-box transcription factor TBX1 [Elysia marginata]|uniref:T-box transcription factor TBX1 n=1 Tax=Elysia marginata TaxID=1093978 RepID=A0AAV4G455_9GAST|nr:T-box transcription factor TBX1 [Elysia marginata]